VDGIKKHFGHVKNMISDTIMSMFRKKPVIEYESAVSYPDQSILPAKNFIPDWYKKIPAFKDNKVYEIDKGFNSTVKLCVPFLDALTTGYMISLPYDVYVKNNEGSPFLTTPSGVPESDMPRWRTNISHEKIVPTGCFPYEYTWNYCISYTLPAGYSALATHPLNRHDLPFITLTGIIDGGLVMYSHGNFPFYIKQGFEGIIPKGTPIVQLIPFRQENWKSKKRTDLVEEGNRHNLFSGIVVSGWYKKTFWRRKRYE
jgi:hypothetical protein